MCHCSNTLHLVVKNGNKGLPQQKIYICTVDGRPVYVNVLEREKITKQKYTYKASWIITNMTKSNGNIYLYLLLNHEKFKRILIDIL